VRLWNSLALAGVALLVAAPAGAQDLYIGTVKVEGDQLVLTRCDLASNRYVLKDGAPEAPAAALRARLPKLKAPVYAEVFGEYEEDGDGNALRVLAIEGVEGGKSCHLLDALEALDKPAAADAPPR